MSVAKSKDANGDTSARRIYPLMKRGMAAGQIALRLQLSRRTVERTIVKIRADEEKFRIKSMREIASSLAWTLEAPCAEMDPSIFVPDDRPTRRAKAPDPCQTCPFTAQCLERGKRTGSEGWWGGKYLTASYSDVMTESEGEPDGRMRPPPGQGEGPLQEAG